MSAAKGRKSKCDGGSKTERAQGTGEGQSSSTTTLAEWKRALAAMERLERLRHVAGCRECQRKVRR